MIRFELPTPRIWYEGSSGSLLVGGDCNCNCGGFILTAVPKPEASNGAFHCCRSELYSQPQDLYVHRFLENYWLACNPTGNGQVVVLNEMAGMILGHFRVPIRPMQMIQIFPDLQPEAIDATVTQFAKLGLIVKSGAPTIDYWSEENTLTAWLHVTNNCNLRCSYCYLQKTPENMADETARRAINAIFRSAARHQIQELTLKYAGGEPSLYLPKVFSIHDYAASLAQDRSIRLDPVLLSNGISLPAQAVTDLTARGIKVMISLDGINDYHDAQRLFGSGKGSFQYVCRTIERLLENGLVPEISITVSNRNVGGLPSLVEYVLENGLRFSLNYYRGNSHVSPEANLQFGEVEMVHGMRSAFEIIERKLPSRSLLGCLIDRCSIIKSHKHACGVGHNYLVIDQAGGVAKCQMDIENTITTIEADDPLQMIRDDQVGIQNRPVDEKEGCKSCIWRYWCSGGCSLLTYRVTGRDDVESPNCGIYRTLFPDVLVLEGLRLLKYRDSWSPSGISNSGPEAEALQTCIFRNVSNPQR